MLTRVLRYIQKYNLLPAGSRVLIGVSGGADSVALLHILCALREKLKIDISAAHFNHGIRDEADGDEWFVKALCATLGAPYIAGRADVPALSKNWGVSLEVAARDARHAFFRDEMAQGGFNRLALAHHRDDQAETVLLRLVRGAGTKGLGAMAPAEAGGIVRPLLCAGRDEIRAYCREHGIEWREDVTNNDNSIPRNWVRNELLPLIRERLNPAAADALCRAAELLRQDEEYLNAEADKALAGTAARPGGGVTAPAADIAKLHPALRSRALRLLIGRAGLTSDVELVNIEDAEALLSDGMSGRRVDLDCGFVVLREGGAISIVPELPEEAIRPPVRLQIPGVTRWAGGMFVSEVLESVPADWKSHMNAVQYFDMDAFTGDALARGRLPGDRFHALGAPGGRKLKEYLIDRKTPRWGRGSIPLLASGSDVLWVVGHGISDKVKITGATARVLKITYINGEEN